jgi:nucleoside-diphosphate-sugar epimerase
MIFSSSATKNRDLIVVNELEKNFIERILIVGGSGFIASGLVNYLQSDNYFMKRRLQVRVFSRSQTLQVPNYNNTKVLFHPEKDRLNNFYREFNPQLVFYVSRINMTGSYKQVLGDNLELLKCHLDAVTTLNLETRFVFLSSGAVYGPRHIDNYQIPMTENLHPDPETLSNYGKIKLFSENLIHHYCKEKGLNATIARLFAFYGPGLPLEEFAIGNFMLSTLHQKVIKIHGKGNTIRSYMYIDDLSATVIRLALKEISTINIGGEFPLNLVELAEIFNKIFGTSAEILAKENFESYYVPDLSKVKNLLGEISYVSMENGLQYWYKSLISDNRI